MTAALDALVRELNPVHDYDRITPETTDIHAPPKETLLHKGKNMLIFVAQLPKHAIRGGVVGGAIGGLATAMYATFTGYSPLEGLTFGALIGAGTGVDLDLTQYMLRLLYHEIRYNII